MNTGLSVCLADYRKQCHTCDNAGSWVFHITRNMFKRTVMHPEEKQKCIDCPIETQQEDGYTSS